MGVDDGVDDDDDADYESRDVGKRACLRTRFADFGYFTGGIWLSFLLDACVYAVVRGVLVLVLTLLVCRFRVGALWQLYLIASCRRRH